MPRPRKHIPWIEIAASFAADRLTEDERFIAKTEGWSARQILGLFTPDHIKLHCWGGDDKWANLDMRRRGPELKAKDIADTKRAAKATRLEKKWRAFTRAMAKGRKPKPSLSRWRTRR